MGALEGGAEFFTDGHRVENKREDPVAGACGGGAADICLDEPQVC